jgi:hypothetical protein
MYIIQFFRHSDLVSEKADQTVDISSSVILETCEAQSREGERENRKLYEEMFIHNELQLSRQIMTQNRIAHIDLPVSS